MVRPGYLWTVALAIISCFSRTVVAQSIQDTVCNYDKSGEKVVAKDVFSFKDSLKARVEVVAPSLQRIIHTDIYFNTKSMLRVNVFSDGWEYHSFHDYNTHETSIYSTLRGKPRSCQVDTNMRGGKGYYLVPDNVPEGEQTDVMTILRLTGPSGLGSDIELVKSPKSSTFRDLTSAEYFSCQKFIDENGDEMVMKVTHVVSDTNFIVVEDGTVPVQIRLEGKYATGINKNQDVSFIYNFYHYKDFVGFWDSIFELPLGVVCEDKKTLSEFPKLPEYMSYGQEIHFPDETTKLQTVKTIFDGVNNYVEETYFNPDGSVKNKRLDDFKSGLSYNVDEKTGDCEVKKISENDKINDFVRGSGDSIQMVTPQQLFHSGGIQFHYNGEKTIDGYLQTEIWSGKDENDGHIYSWFFTKNVNDSVNHYAQVFKGQHLRIPYKRMVWDNEESDPTTTYFYMVDYTKPKKTIHPLNCFQGSPKRLYMALPGLKQDQLVKDQSLVTERILNTLIDALGISWLRIDYLYIRFYDKIGITAFSLLGPSKVQGDKVQGMTAKQEPTLEEAYALLKRKLAGGLTFDVGNDDVLMETGGLLVASPYENSINLYEGSGGDSSGYSSGAMAGLAIGMIILGLAAGLAGGFWFFVKSS